MCHILGLLILAAAVGAAIPACRAEQGARVEYMGGTRADLPNGCSGVLQAIDEKYLVFYSKKANLRIAYDRVNMLEYGQTVSRRYAMAVLISPVLLIAKSRRHFLTVGYTDENGNEQALIFKVDKGDIRAILVSLEARTGRRVVYQDQEARKAGKG
jgi:hypothetical protein